MGFLPLKESDNNSRHAMHEERLGSQGRPRRSLDSHQEAYWPVSAVPAHLRRGRGWRGARSAAVGVAPGARCCSGC